MNARIRARAADRRGRALAPGTRVRIAAEEGQAEGTVVRVLDDYGTVTVLIEKPAKAERMYPITEVEAL
ncbi:MAG: hypothetical protein E6G99_06530 [Bacillati bacterium ANGP1]|uniref:KOW domain-containing protein n=1 Tax=Candidatus Segetimicrobium genomatis TaxID=2569760 RepID=A0A537LHP1_9BACT|nr:MAG: hypothetical protein E6G99_06530 [Terrabacteria group bacterium ANGP1]TMJ09373.1 MAG: hypothetical protein E6G98_09740 [Terrabacteria group bacterium ANGP1]